MTALAQNTTEYSHPTGNPTRRGGSLVLRGAHIFVGALCFFHDDGVAPSSRLMPARSLNNANTPAQGGPLQAAAGASNGYRLIARVPNVTYTGTMSGGGSAVTSVAVVYGTTAAVTVTFGSTATAATIVRAIMADAELRSLLDGGIYGDGSATGLGLALSKVPFVRIAGFSKREHDNSANASTDLALTSIVVLDTGIGFMANDVTDPASASDVGGMVTILDDQTIARTQVPLQLPVFLFDWVPIQAGASGPAIRIP